MIMIVKQPFQNCFMEVEILNFQILLHIFQHSQSYSCLPKVNNDDDSGYCEENDLPHA